LCLRSVPFFEWRPWISKVGCLIFATRSPTAGGGVWPEKTLTATAIGSYDMVTAASGAVG
jgi:hypothetical protein